MPLVDVATDSLVIFKPQPYQNIGSFERKNDIHVPFVVCQRKGEAFLPQNFL